MDPKQFDIGNKNYLTHQEYVSYALANYKTPKSKNEIGDVIPYDKIKFKNNFYDCKSIFNILSQNEDFIDFGTLKKTLKKLDLDIKDQEIQQLIDFYGKNDKISYNTFKKTFEEEEEE